MSVAEVSISSPPEEVSLKTSSKRKADQAELEVDLNAPEPPSKKALRKAKKVKTDPSSTSSTPGLVKTSGSQSNDTASTASKRSPHGIWIGNLAFTTTKEDLLKFITGDTDHPLTQEKVTRIHLPSSGSKFGKAQNKGFAYIDFSDAESLTSALELSEKLLAGRRVLIKNANNFEGRPQRPAGADGNADGKGRDDDSKPPSKRVFIGNLDFSATVEDLESHFGVCGNIVHTHMATFEDSGKCKGFAWIEFENVDDARKAMRGWVEEGYVQDDEADDQDQSEKRGKRSNRRIWLHKFHGRKVRMEYAEDKAVRYQKRFGKEGQKNESGADAESNQSGGQTLEEGGADESKHVAEASRAPARQFRERKDNKRKSEAGGYDQATVSRIRGGIVESKGSKMTFD